MPAQISANSTDDGAARAARLIDNWVYGGALAGLLLLALMPTLTAGWPLADTLVFLVLPIYMIHQYEEHDGDRFRRFINDLMAGGREAMTRRAVFVINIPGVWLPLAVCLILTRGYGSAYASFAGWLILVNALLHVGVAAKTKSYNPGLVTGLVLFLPLGLAVLVAGAPQAGFVDHVIGLTLAMALHVAIIIYMRWRIAKL